MELWVNILHRLKPGDFREARTSVQFALQLTLECMPGTTPFGGRRPCTRTLRRHLAQLGRTDMPILVAPIPAAPIFSERVETKADLARPPYVVVCGTIQPRKNHLLLLHVWRELVRRDGAAAPKLVGIKAFLASL